MQFDCTGAFPNERRARIVWVGTQRAEPAYRLLAETVRSAARAFAALDEKPAIAHVTIARLRDPQRVSLPQFRPCTLTVRDVVLFESLPAGETTRYEVVARFPLTVQVSAPAAST